MATRHSVRIIIFFLIEHSNRQQVIQHTVDCSIYWKSRYCICSITIMKLMISNLFNKLFLHLNIYIKSTSWWDHISVFTQKYVTIINTEHIIHFFFPSGRIAGFLCSSHAKQKLSFSILKFQWWIFTKLHRSIPWGNWGIR